MQSMSVVIVMDDYVSVSVLIEMSMFLLSGSLRLVLFKSNPCVLQSFDVKYSTAAKIQMC